MKSYISFFAITATTFLLSSCSGDDAASDLSGTGTVNVEFDNAFGADDLILGAPNPNSLSENLSVTTAKYIVGNFRFIKSDGTTVSYQGDRHYFIVDETDASSLVLALGGIPAGDYTKVTFGVGVSQDDFNLGASGQGDFLAEAQAEDLLWSWSAGYKFAALEGSFTSASVTEPAPFMIHTGQTGSAYNYTEVTLDLPAKALVRQGITPQVHLVADLSRITDGTHKIELSAHNGMGMGAMIMGGTILSDITANISGMFRVDHVHN